MTEHFDFCFGDEKAGYQVYERRPDRIAWHTRFRLDDEEIEASHEVELADGRVTRFRADGGDWIDASAVPDDAMPTAGVTLLLERMDAEDLDVLDYPAVDESTGEMLGPTRLRRKGGWIVEERDGEEQRRFQTEDGRLLRADWGGPIASRQPDERAARAGSPYALD